MKTVYLCWSGMTAGEAHIEHKSKTAEVVGNMTPDFLGSVATTLTWKDLSLNVGLDMRFGGLVASYCNLYGTQAGWTESSLQYRDPEHGGMTWTSQYADSKGIQYTDGMIPEGVFKEGTIATLVDGTKMDVSGLSYAQLVQEGKTGTHSCRFMVWK